MHSKSLVLDAYDFQRQGDNTFSVDSFKKVAAEVGDSREWMYQSGDENDQNRLLDSEFGIILVLPNGDRLRKYPIDSKTNLQMSLTAFQRVYGKLPYGMVGVIARRFEVAADRYGVDISSEPWYSMLASVKGTPGSHYYPITAGMLDTVDRIMEKQASQEPTGNYAITHDVNGAPFQKYPINTKAQLNHAMDVLEKNATQWLAEYAVQMAQAIEKRATELKIEIDEDSCVHKYAAQTYSPYAYGHIMARTTMVKDMDSYMAYRDLAEKVASQAYTPAQAVVMLDNLDHANKLHYQWHSRGLTNPLDSILAHPIKTARLVSVSGVDIDVSKLQDMAINEPGPLTERLGGDLVARLRSDPENALLTMPAPQRTVILDVMGRQS